eukprot:scaffold38014_cov144-Skeletonema_dohrnii-CCMP3373.AAC.1
MNALSCQRRVCAMNGATTVKLWLRFKEEMSRNALKLIQHVPLRNVHVTKITTEGGDARAHLEEHGMQIMIKGEERSRWMSCNRLDACRRSVTRTGNYD